jgi:predicted nucleotide-binding protein
MKEIKSRHINTDSDADSSICKVENILNGQILSAKVFLDKKIVNDKQFEELLSNLNIWELKNYELLKKIPSISGATPLKLKNATYINDKKVSLQKRKIEVKRNLGISILKLQTAKELLSLNRNFLTDGTHSIDNHKSNPANIFIVHGHNNEAKLALARYLEKLGLKAIILHEQANFGKAIIEKFETNASDINYAIVILSPDDEFISTKSPLTTNFRARQNVILELGYFYGLLGRSKVAVMVIDNIEIPSDILGIAYIKMDDTDGWKFKLAKELSSAGINFDPKLALI